MSALSRLFKPALLIGLSILLAGPLVPPVVPSLAAATLQVQPNVVPSGDDFATQVLANPWDMSEPLDIDLEKTRQVGNVTNLTINSGGNGLLEATATNGDPRIWIRIPKVPEVNPVPQEGAFAPIDATAYRYVTARVWVERTEPATGLGNAMVYWQSRVNELPHRSDFGRLKPGWNIVTFDLASMPGWTGTIEGFYFDPVDLPVSFKVDFIRLSANLPSITIPLTGQPSDVWVGRAADGSDAALIAQRQSGANTVWQASLAAGTYYIWVVPFGRLPSGTPTHTLPVNAMPLVTINAPSYLSGPDYATSVLGNPWDMSDPADIAVLENIANPRFQDGIFSGSNDLNNPDPGRRGDPGLRLRVGTPINTSVFKYLTVRMLLEGEQDEINGSVARILWWDTRPEENTTSRSWVVYEGWQSVSFDLSQPDFKLEPNPLGARPWTASRPTIFRFDPHEFGDSMAAIPNIRRQFFIDYIALTGDDRASGSYALRYSSFDADGAEPQLNFFYDADGQGFDGQAIRCGAAATASTLPAAAVPVQAGNRAYLPYISVPPEPPDNFIELTGATCQWDLRGVPAGTYWIYVVSTDGVDTYRTYSQVPLIVE